MREGQGGGDVSPEREVSGGKWCEARGEHALLLLQLSLALRRLLMLFGQPRL